MLLQIFKTQSIRNIVHDDWSCLFATAVTVMVVATSEGLPLSATLTCGIFYEMHDAWIHHGLRTFCLLHNGLSQKKKKNFTDKTGTWQLMRWSQQNLGLVKKQQGNILPKKK